jgi:hypothetical protein
MWVSGKSVRGVEGKPVVPKGHQGGWRRMIVDLDALPSVHSRSGRRREKRLKGELDKADGFELHRRQKSDFATSGGQ